MKCKGLIKATWEVPQNMLGSIIKRVCKATPITTYKDATVYYWNISGGMSLGKYIFVPFRYDGTRYYIPTDSGIQRDVYLPTDYAENFIKHEYGHTIQSKYLGWLYLLVIGAPSLIWANCFGKYREKTGKSYYDFYTEKWADKLGGVDRGE